MMTRKEAFSWLTQPGVQAMLFHYDNDTNEALRIAVGALKSQQRWIPTAERLPDRAGFYLVTKKQKNGAVQIALGNYSPKFGWSGSGNFNNVLAWLPIPEPYTEDDA